MSEFEPIMSRRVLVIDHDHQIHQMFRRILSDPSVSRSDEFGTGHSSSPGQPSRRSYPAFDLDVAHDGPTGLQITQRALRAETPYVVAFVALRLASAWSGSETVRKLWGIDPSLHCVLYADDWDICWEEVLNALPHRDRLFILQKPFASIEVRQMACALTQKRQLAERAQLHLDGMSSVAAERALRLQEANARLVKDIERRRRAEERNARAAREVERQHAELASARDALASAKSYMEKIIGSMADMLVVIAPDMTIGSVNQALLTVLGFSEHEVVGAPPSFLFGEELADQAILERLLLQGWVQNVETTCLTKQRERIPVCLSGSLMQDESHTILGMVCVAQDIRERQRIDEERRLLNDRLVETSRRLGMADVATSVLHNVGNVLNSINVSAGLLSHTVRRSLVGDVQRLSDLLAAHADDLGYYLTEDRKGRKIPGYLAQLAAHLLEERRILLKELEALANGTEHAKQCVAMQQGMAKSGGLYEPLDILALVEQAVVINEGGLEAAEVAVQWDAHPLPMVVGDKHQVLQILVNLIRNARQAMETASTRLLRLVLASSEHGSGTVTVAVHDTGVGIAPENLSRLFAQGFTTKPDGHGFGLHSAALLAKNMGGGLTATSEGIGRGATFVLSLPAQHPLCVSSAPGVGHNDPRVGGVQGAPGN